ncbi:putative acetyltransferase EpsM [bacterium BMS3Bbin08]|nr:putative acetyltransferase EpsM [bacterium BMS3Bbin08]
MSKAKIILLGGGGHSKVLIELIRMSGEYEITGILDPGLEKGKMISGASVLGGDDLLPELHKKGISDACISLGSVKDNSKRKKLFEIVKETGFSVPCLIHPQAIVSRDDTKISEGVQIMAGAIVQTGSFIGENTIINTGAIVEHDCRVGKHVHICPGAVISGGCTIDEGAFIGAGTTIIQGIKIGKKTVVAAGSLVVNDVSDGVVVMGTPAK